MSIRIEREFDVPRDMSWSAIGPRLRPGWSTDGDVTRVEAFWRRSQRVALSPYVVTLFRADAELDDGLVAVGAPHIVIEPPLTGDGDCTEIPFEVLDVAQELLAIARREPAVTLEAVLGGKPGGAQ